MNLSPSFASLGQRATLLAALLGSFCSAALAAPVTYNNRASFESAFVVAGSDNFNDLTTGEEISSPSTRSLGNGLSYTASSTEALYASADPIDGFLTNRYSGEAIVLSFSFAVNSIGFNLFGSTEEGTFIDGKTITVVVTEFGGARATMYTLATLHRDSFFGFVGDSAITSVSITAAVSDQEYWPSIDNLIVSDQRVAANAGANAVPEPGALSLMAGSLAALAVVRRRKPAAASA